MDSSFNWAKGLGFGALIWLILFAFTSALVGFEVMDTFGGQTLTMGVAAILTYGLSYSIRPADGYQAFGYGFLWAAIGILLDLVITYQFNPAVFSAWQYWVSYALVLFMPMVETFLQPARKHSLA